MVICPNCQTENRSGAKFCRSCAARLPDTPASGPLAATSSEAATLTADGTRPRKGAPTLRLDQTLGNTSPIPVSPARTDTQPLAARPNMNRRPAGAIFGDAFVYRGLVFSNEHQNHYLVTQIETPEAVCTRVCPNPACGAFFPPRQDNNDEKFCTDCGTVLEPNNQDLMLIETDGPFPDNLLQVVAKGLSHGGVRAPLFTFDENVSGAQRYCLVTPQYSAFPAHLESSAAFLHGASLARALDYLHDNGVEFGGRVSAECLGLANERAVWSNLAGAGLHPDGHVSDRTADLRALAGVIFFWLTGKMQVERDPALLPPVQQIFDRAATGQGYASGVELAEALEQVGQELGAPQSVDFHMGRRTHVGMVRNLNEDSLLAMEINRIQQSVSQPLGVYAVADGMGGHAAGEVASGMIVNAIAEKATADLVPVQLAQGGNQDRSEWLRQAVETANRKVFELRKAAGTDMGSTLVAAVLDGPRAHIAHVGDSRIYLVNSQGIRQLTTDHSLVERLIATGQISREDARHHPQRNVIYRTIGDKLKLDVDLAVIMMKPGDNLLLCSDGLSGMVEDAKMCEIVQNASSPQAACDALIDAANAAGGEDNVTVVIIQVVQV